MSAQPNILLIVLDTLRRDRLSAYGHDRETSPEFDDFASRATLFERAVTPAQWTIPAHASIFTGLYASTHQVIQGNGKLSGSYPTLAEILQVAGYHTAAFCNNPLVSVLDNGLQRGFDHFFNYAGAAPERPRDMTRSAARRALATRFRRFAHRVQNRFANNDSLFRLSLHPLLTPIWSRYVNFKGNTSNSIDDVIAYWERHQAGGKLGGSDVHQPLFTFVNLMGAHLPYRPPGDYLNRFAPDLRNDERALSFMRRFNADAAAWASPPDKPFEDWERRTLDGFYDAEIAHQDYHLGRLLRYMRESGALDNTMVIITADHGEAHGDHDFFGHGFVVYQELVHVPLVIHSPERFPAGVRAGTNVSTRRIFHTVLESAGLKPPIDDSAPNADVHQLTLANATNGHPDVEGGIAYAEAFPVNTFLNTLKHRSPAVIEQMRLRQVRRGIYAGQHKLMMVHHDVEGLYDVAHDPAETQNIVTQHTPLVSDLQRKIQSFVKDAEDQRADRIASSEVSAEVEENLRALGYIE